MNKYDEQEAYKKAKKRIEEEKGFYSHLATYVAINIALFFFNSHIVDYIGADLNDPGTQKWFYWNTILTPILWGIGLLIHGLWVFKEKTFLKKYFNKSVFSKDWEERKIKEFMDQDKKQT